MTEDTPDQPHRQRGKGFPTMALSEAVDILDKAALFGLEHHMDAFAGYMGHQKASGGAFNTRIAALRDYGLIKRSTGRVSLTELARRIALPTDDEQRRADLQTAFLTPPPFAEAYERSAKGTPIRLDSFGNAAVHNIGISPGSKDKFVRSFVAGAETVGLGQTAPDGGLLLNPTSRSTPRTQPDAAPLNEPAPGPTAAGETRAATSHAQFSGGPVAFDQQVRFEGGMLHIRVEMDAPLPRKAFRLLNNTMADFLDQVEEGTTASPTEAPADGTSDTSG